jgi:ankyrin repeat protein
MVSVGVGLNHDCVEDGRTPLYLACQRKNLDIMSLLLKSGAEIETRSPVSCVSFPLTLLS